MPPMLSMLTSPPAEEQLTKVAELLNYPIELFREDEVRLRSGASACLYHRKRKTLPAKLLNQLDAEMYLRS